MLKRKRKNQTSKESTYPREDFKKQPMGTKASHFQFPIHSFFCNLKKN